MVKDGRYYPGDISPVLTQEMDAARSRLRKHLIKTQKSLKKVGDLYKMRLGQNIPQKHKKQQRTQQNKNIKNINNIKHKTKSKEKSGSQ